MPDAYMTAQYIDALLDTLTMVGAAAFISTLGGLALALVLITTGPGDLYASPKLHRVVSNAVNLVRSVPFIILLVVLLPLTRVIVGTTIGVWAAVVPLATAGVPFFARIAEISLREVDRGLIEAALAMGALRTNVIRHVLLPEALPGIVSGITITVVAMIGSSAMAGAVGAGGLGDLAIRYGYQRFNNVVMFTVLVGLMGLVTLVQFGGDTVVRKLNSRR